MEETSTSAAATSAAGTELKPRRSFLKSALAALVGGIVVVVPAAAGLLVWLDPLRRKRGGADYVPVTTLDALPPDGKPRKFRIIADRTDAWTKYPRSPIGAVYLKRTPERLTAFNVVCPHAGCFVDVAKDGDSFLCPCHNSKFHPDGSIVVGQCVSPRGLDELEVETTPDGQVRVRFQNFVAGRPERKPV